jgi:hypothetical protein
MMNETHKLSDELVACRTQVGVMLHQCVQSADCPDEMTADGQPGMPLVALGHQEMLELIAWYCREEATPNGDLIAFALQLVVAGAIKERTATVALRALMARSAAEAVDAALTGWVMPHEEYE